jgi:hypothetical protein
MHNASVAEWIISRFTGRDRAASVVGDLLETLPQRGLLRFWISVGGIVFSLAWRRPVAFVAASYVGWRAVGALQMPIYGMHAAHRPPHVWMPLFAVLGTIGMLLWTMAPYAAIRFGVRDRFTQLAAAYSLAIAGVIFYWWIPLASISAVAVMVGLSIFSIVAGRWRRTLVAVCGAAGGGLGGWLLVLYIDHLYEKRLYPNGVGSFEASQMKIWFCLVAVAAIWCTTSACSRAHYYLQRYSARDSRLMSTD